MTVNCSVETSQENRFTGSDCTGGVPCLEPAFQIKNKYTELQVWKLCACVCTRGGNIYCITQRADMKPEDALFRVAIVRLHTILSHKQGLISHAAGLCRSCFGY